MATFNIVDLYRQSFGYVGVPYFTANPASYVPFANLEKQEVNEFKVQQRSILGTPLFMPCKLDGWQLPNEPIIQISGSKHIIETKIDGQDGTFKQLFSLNDYRVVIRGIAINEEDDEYPEEQIRKIREICEKRMGIKITNALATIFNITQLSIDDFDFPPVEGSPSMQPYVITAKSDKERTLKLKTKG